MIFSSEILLKRGAVKNLAVHLSELQNYSKIVILTDSTVEKFYGEDLRHALKKLNIYYIEIIIPPGETSKSWTQFSECCQSMWDNSIDRQSAIVGLGGGVVSDLVGFIASSYMRGIDAFYIPTTLMAMVDASIGGKTGINLPCAKNLIGSFYPPQKIIIDPNVLKSLDEREFNSGIAEIIKYGLIADNHLFQILNEHIDVIVSTNDLTDEMILKCIEIKNSIIKEDFKDLHGKRALLNYGHTFAHAFESATQYQHFLHGEAVSIGMSCAVHLSHALSLCNHSTVHLQDQLCTRAKLPIALPSLPIELLMKTIRGDKKNVYGKINLILLEEIGKGLKVSDVDSELIKKVLCAKMG